MKPGFMIAGSVILLLLVASVFALTSLRLPFINPSGSTEIILLFVLSTIIFLSLVIFGFILFRSLFKLYLERRANQLGSKFKTKMVFGALALSVAPVFFLFLFSYSLLNRTLDKWFSRPYETISRDAQELVAEIRVFARNRAAADAEILASQLRSSARTIAEVPVQLDRSFPSNSPPRALDYFGVLDSQGTVLFERGAAPGPQADMMAAPPAGLESAGGDSSSRILDRGGESFAVAWATLQVGGQTGTVVAARRLPSKITESAARLDQESVLYGALSQERRSVRTIYLSILLLLTVLILFIATWFALFLSRQVTVPIQALAEATHEVSRGNLEYRVGTKAADELGILVRSFNEMTEQLGAGRSALEQSRAHLERINRELDQRRQFTEAILESIPTGVLTVSGTGMILASNSAARRLFGRDPGEIGHIAKLFPGEDWREFRYLLKRAARIGQATHHLEIKQEDRTLQVAVTVSALSGEPPDSANRWPGSSWFVLVMEDLSDLLQAQKSAAWGEVAQRIAHEIKNPLTPIALSAERIRLWMDRRLPENESPDLKRVVTESCSLIQQEVGHLQRLLNEFAQFARFPEARPTPSSLNQVIESALTSFNGRLDGICIRTRLAPDLPTVQVDPEHFRRVFVNLIDNAAEAMEQSLVKELVVTTRVDAQREVVEAEVCDTGCGVTPQDKEKLFLPYFSTKDRGTGLGLAIVNRIVAEHRGTIRAEENQPVGTRFIIELPTAAA
ncbi:MAG: multi-sensor signal transduction histidine kinase [Acidobacteria bacterium]|nr:multi-sensor signal transduction histidine kinase [Acidobacteriota bacterium]